MYIDASDPEIRRAIRKGLKRAILPVGSIEQHGPHLPVNTDTLIAEEVAKRLSFYTGSLLLPSIPYALSSEHKPLFSITIKDNTLLSLISEICSSLAENGIEKVAILNAHYGNEALLSTIPKTFSNIFVYVLSYWLVLDNNIGHADDIETSLMLAIKPESVDMKKAKRGKAKVSNEIILSRLTPLRGSFPKLTSNGVMGNPENANREKGEVMLDSIAKRLAEIIKDLEGAYESLFKDR